MAEQRDSTTSDGTILPLRMVANILRLRLDVGWVLLIVRAPYVCMMRGSGPRFRGSGGINTRIKKPAGGRRVTAAPCSFHGVHGLFV